jgi:pimeloyl-ACP methyl ester carboxylesterase
MARVFSMQRARVGDVELEYDIQGTGEPVVLIHRSHVAGGFVPLMHEPALNHYRLIRSDRRGLEGSSRTGPTSIQQ